MCVMMSADSIITVEDNREMSIPRYSVERKFVRDAQKSGPFVWTKAPKRVSSLRGMGGVVKMVLMRP